MRSTVFFAFAAATLAGCAKQLEPAPGADEVPGLGMGAQASEAGVVVEARTEAWFGQPDNLDDELTPMLVRIHNNSNKPVRISYSMFDLVAQDGEVFNAIPPYNIDETVTEPVQPLYAPTGFTVAPYLGSYYPMLTPTNIAYPYDEVYYGQYYPSMTAIELPTADMLARALPEGVLEPGGSVAGFLYFEEVQGIDVDRVQFQARLDNAATGEQLASITIPFVTGDEQMATFEPYDEEPVEPLEPIAPY